MNENEKLSEAMANENENKQQEIEVVAYDDLTDAEKKAYDQLFEDVEKVIDDIINPQLEKHSGWIELVDIQCSTAIVRFRGACSACEGVQETVDSIVVPALRRNVRAIRNVEITDEVDPDVWEMAKSLFTHRSDN